jgi:thiamine-monophosphate kinase
VFEIFDELNFVPSAMIDISDGLSSDILHICQDSGVGCVINENDLPISEEVRMRAMKFSIPASTAALNGGEDYELLFTFPANLRHKIENLPDFSIIGHITKPKDGFKFKSKSGQMHDLEAQGWTQM